MTIRDLQKTNQHIILCNGDACTLSGAAQMISSIRAKIKNCGLNEKIHTTRSLCNGRCNDGPVVIVYPDAVWYKKVNPLVAEKIVEQHLLNNKIVEENLLFHQNKQKTQNEEINL